MNWTPQKTEFIGGIILIIAFTAAFIIVNCVTSQSITINRIIGAISGFCVTFIIGVVMVIKSNNKKP